MRKLTKIGIGAAGAVTVIVIAGVATAQPKTAPAGTQAPRIVAVTAAPTTAPRIAGTFSGSCDYLIGGDPLNGTAVATGEIDLTNTGNVGTISRVVITWPQEGFAPLRAARTVRVAAGSTRRVSLRHPLTYDQITALQSWQTGHGYADGCRYRSVITGKYGSPS